MADGDGDQDLQGAMGVEFWKGQQQPLHIELRNWDFVELLNGTEGLAYLYSLLSS